MACDMVVALGPATVGQATLVGINQHGVAGRRPIPRRFAARHCSPDETILLTHLQLPQAREVYTVLGSQQGDQWGFTHGVNENRVVMGYADWCSKVEHARPGLLGAELVRLVLERTHSASHAVEVLTDLVGRYGQCASSAEMGGTDQLFLIADAQEAYVVEAAGKYWAVQECHQVRAVADVALIRQDWCRLAPGLAGHAEQCGWWTNDGSKLDFAGRLETMTPQQPFALRRWGRATVLLEQQNGHLDLNGIRRLLIEHFDDTVIRRRPQQHQPASQLHTAFSVQIPVHADEPTLAWIGLGPVGNELFFPLILEGELPPLLESGPLCRALTQHPAWMSAADSKQWHVDLAQLQLRLDLETEAFAREYVTLKRQGNDQVLRRKATSFMQAQGESLSGTANAETHRHPSVSRQSEYAFVAE